MHRIQENIVIPRKLCQILGFFNDFDLNRYRIHWNAAAKFLVFGIARISTLFDFASAVNCI